MKKTRKLPINDEDVIDSSFVSSAVTKVTTSLPVITSRAQENDGENQPVMVIA